MNRTLLTVLTMSGLFIIVEPAFAQTWSSTSAPTEHWDAIASSADGSKLVAVIGGDYSGSIYTSTNSGATWLSNNTPIKSWSSVASSADGTKLVAVFPLGPIYTSTNSGATWTATTAPNDFWYSVASSSDGAKLVAAARVDSTFGPGLIYSSTNSGGSWTATSAPSNYWDAVGSSADGSKLVAGVYNGPVYASTNSGESWTQTIIPAGYDGWSLASSADGSKWWAVVIGVAGPIYGSSNSGETWEATSAPNQNWRTLSSSADGSRLVAAADPFIYTSTNSGITWVSNSAPSTSWQAVASSADGNKLAAAARGDSIYTSQSIPAPVLNIASTNGNALISWTIPSTDFVLQQNSDLTTTNWTDVPMPPILNLKNLQNQVMVPPTNDATFYRLKSL